MLFAGMLMHAQEMLTFTDVIEVDGATKQQLYNRASQWFTKAYVSSNDVVQKADPINGIIIGKGKWVCNGSKTYYYTTGTISHTIELYFKEGRFKYIITQISHKADYNSEMNSSMGLITDADTYTGYVGLMVGKGMKKKMWNGAKKKVNESVTLTVIDITNHLSMKAVYENDDW